MSNLATVTPIRPSLAVVERQVADLDDGYTRIANELLEAVMAADLTARQLKVVLAVIRKTYGFGKKFDRITNTQISDMTGIHHTHVCKAKNEMISMGVIITNGLMIGVNKVVSDWNFNISQHSGTLDEIANKRLAKSANTNKPIQLNTKETIQNKKENTPLTPLGENSLAQGVMDYFNELTGSRCSAIAPFEKALTTVKSKGQCYSADELKLVIRWAHANWKPGFKPGNLCRMTRFDGYLSDALVWADGQGSNPVPCPHKEIIALWNEKFPGKSVVMHEWSSRRPAYRNLAAVWNGKTNQGNWREVKHLGQAFDLIGKSTLFSGAENKPWLTLDWILKPENWGAVYEQAINEYRQRKGIIA